MAFSADECIAYLALSICALIIAVRCGTKGGARRTIATVPDATPLGEVLLPLLLPDLNLLLFAAPTQLVRLECALCLEVGAAMLGNVALRHVFVVLNGDVMEW
jgi:hypothetical protein